MNCEFSFCASGKSMLVMMMVDTHSWLRSSKRENRSIRKVGRS